MVILLVIGIVVVLVIIVIILKYKTKHIGDAQELQHNNRYDPSEKFQGVGERSGEHLDNPVYSSAEGCKPLPQTAENLERLLMNPLYDIKMGTKDNQPNAYAVLESEGPEYAVPEAVPKPNTDSGATTAGPIPEATVKHPYDYVEPTTDSGDTSASPEPEVTVEHPHDHVELTTGSVDDGSATPVPEASDLWNVCGTKCAKLMC